VEAPDEPPVRVVLERGAHESQGVGLVFPCRQFPGLSLVAAVPSERGEEGGSGDSRCDCDVQLFVELEDDLAEGREERVGFG
jgi:hypothetical protein